MWRFLGDLREMTSQTKPSESRETIVVYCVAERNEESKFDLNFPIVCFYDRKKALDYKHQRQERILTIRRLEIQ